MKTTEVNSYKDLQQKIGSEKRSFLLLYKQGSELSDKALLNIEKAAGDVSDMD